MIYKKYSLKWLSLITSLLLWGCVTPINHVKLGNQFADNGQHDQAIIEYTRAIEIDSTDASAYIYRALSYIEKGNYAGALSDSERVIALKPEFAYAYFIKGMSCENLQRYGEAIEAYRSFVQYAVSEEDQSLVNETWQRIDELRKK
jgi:tetratricopeptide (TPR) repeat protein